MTNSSYSAGWMGSMAWATAAMFSPVSSLMFLRWGHRPVSIAGVIACFVGLLVTALMPVLWAMYISFGLVFAAGTNVVMNTGVHLVALSFPGKKGMRPFALQGLSGGVGKLGVLFFRENFSRML